MSNPLDRTKDAKVGSNLKARKRLAAADAALFERRLKPIRLAKRAYARQLGAIVTKPVVKNAAEVVRQHRDAYHQAFARANGNGEAIRKALASTRASVGRALRASVPKFAEYEALRDKHSQDRRDLIAKHVLSAQIGLDFGQGEILLPDGVAFQQFMAPYELFDVTPVEPPSQENRSFANPKAGIAVTDVQFRNHHSSRITSLFEFNPARVGELRSSVGIKFRVPQTGMLTGSATMQNLFAKFVLSATDNLGFSSAFLHVDHTIFVTIIRPGEIQRFEQNVFSNGLVARGDDLGVTLSPILDSSPFTVSFTGRDAFLKGEQIQILVGQAVRVEIDLNDMDSFVSALTVWQVKKLSIGIRA